MHSDQHLAIFPPQFFKYPFMHYNQNLFVYMSHNVRDIDTYRYRYTYTHIAGTVIPLKLLIIPKCKNI